MMNIPNDFNVKRRIFFSFALIFCISESAAERTSVDLYCDTMVFTFLETTLYLSKKPISNEKLKQVESDMNKFCKSTPAMESALISNMNAATMSIVSCVGFAEGAYVGHMLGKPEEPYSKLRERREFSANACALNAKKFQNDIFKHGPDYVLKQNY